MFFKIIICFFILTTTLSQNNKNKLNNKGNHQGNPPPIPGNQTGFSFAEQLAQQIIRDDIRIYLDQTNLTQKEKTDTLNKVDEALNTTFLSFQNVKLSSQDTFKNMLISLPFTLPKLTEEERDLYYQDYIYFAELKPERRQDLASYIAYNISQLLNNSKATGKDNILSCLKRFDEIIKFDKQTPNPVYEIPEDWKKSMEPPQQEEADIDLNKILNDQDIQKQIDEFFNPEKPEKPDWDQWNKNLTENIDSYIPEDQNITEQDKKELKELVNKAVKNLNTTIQNRTIEERQAEQNQQQGNQPPQGPNILLIFLILAAVGGLGFYIGRRRQLKILQQNQHFQLNGQGEQIKVDEKNSAYL